MECVCEGGGGGASCNQCSICVSSVAASCDPFQANSCWHVLYTCQVNLQLHTYIHLVLPVLTRSTVEPLYKGHPEQGTPL